MTDDYLRVFHTSLPMAEGRAGRYLTRFYPLEMHNRRREHDMEATTGHAAEGMSLNLSLPRLMGYAALAGILSGTGLRGFRPFLVTAILFAEVELPRIILRQRGIRPATIFAAVGLAAVTNLCHAGGDIFFLAALLGTVELALFAGWMPFARRPGRDRMILSVLFYSLTIGTVVWGYYAWSRGN